MTLREFDLVYLVLFQIQALSFDITEEEEDEEGNDDDDAASSADEKPDVKNWRDKDEPVSKEIL